MAAATGLAGVRLMIRPVRDRAAFLCSCAYIVAMLAAAAFGQYPRLLPAIGAADASLTVANASTSRAGLAIGLYWFMPGMILVAAYFVFAYRHLLRRPSAADT